MKTFNPFNAKATAAGIGAALCLTSMLSAAVAAQSPSDASATSTAVSDSLAKPATNVKFNDAEILGWVLVVDSNEIAAATVAEKKKLSPDAMAYAKMLRDEHRADAKKTIKLAKKLKLVPVSNPLADDLRSKGSSDLAALSSKDGSDFEKAYIDAMVKGHADALQTLDTQVIPNAVDPATKKALGELRGHVAMHLEHGKRLQSDQASR